jgi:1,4-alpha-glucan branching enzyme
MVLAQLAFDASTVSRALTLLIVGASISCLRQFSADRPSGIAADREEFNELVASSMASALVEAAAPTEAIATEVVTRNQDARQAPSRPPPPPFTLAGKSVYFVMVDRFAHSTQDAPPCGGDVWCGGSLRALTAQLGYIQALGFDCVWVTPVSEQLRGRACMGEWCGYAYHGYWTQNFYRVDRSYGTEEDLATLSRELHARGM